MNFKKMVYFCVLMMVTGILSLAQASAEPVLIRLTLKEANDWRNATSLGVEVYQRFDDFVLAEFDRTELKELDRFGLKYQIIDEHPWTEDYFLVSSIEGIKRVNLKLYGKILLEDPKWQLIKASSGRASELRKMRYPVIPIHHIPLPLLYKSHVVLTMPVSKYSVSMDSLLNLVSQDSLYAWDLRLQNFMTRYSYSDSIIRARDWLYNKFLSFGIDSVWLHYYHDDSDQWNVVATVPGTTMPDKVLVVGGHYDSINSYSSPLVWAPGADDNGSGTVATLEMARIIAQHPLPVTVMFVPFAQEEQGLVGSYYFAQYLFNYGTDVEFMINSDMIGHSIDSDPDLALFGDTSTLDYVNIMIAMARVHTTLRPYYGGVSYASDQASFFQWGYNAVAAGEGDFHYAGWHTNYDVIDSLSFPYMKEVVQTCLATLIFVANNHPFPVEDLRAIDAGDGHTIYLSWSANPPIDSVVYYKVYFGTGSGNYDSVYQINATSDTLQGLEENATYFFTVAAVNANGFEGAAIDEVSIAPRVAPLPPTGLVANPIGPLKVELSWRPNQEADFDYYNIYRGEDTSMYLLLSGSHQDTTFVDSTMQSSVECYYYTVTAVDTSGNESQKSNVAQAYTVTLDQGLLVVDETYENGFYNMVNGTDINAFYDRALQEYTYAYVDHSCPNCYPQNQLHLTELGRYSVVMVHSEDNRGNRSLGDLNDSTYLILKKYLNYGGKVIIEGRRNLSRGNDGDAQIRQFFPGDIPYDYLKVKSAYVPLWSQPFYRTEEFIGAFSQISGYPDLLVDSLRVERCSEGINPPLAGKVPGVGYIDSLMAGEVIYKFHSAYDTSSSEGKPVAFRYSGTDYKLVYFDFPLYFIQEAQACSLLHKALNDLGIYPSLVKEEEESQAPTSFSLKQNFPNPFNSETVIEYSLPKENQVKMTIYNLLGQKVKVLLDQKESAGHKKVFWDGKNDKGEMVSSGIYFYRIEAGKFAQTKKMVLLK